jgi:CYTH domain-containing protein
MPHAIIRGKSGRRHEVDFEGSALRVEVYAGDETAEIFVEADTDELPEERRRFALINSPRHLFSQATAEAAKRKNERLR